MIKQTLYLLSLSLVLTACGSSGSSTGTSGNKPNSAPVITSELSSSAPAEVTTEVRLDVTDAQQDPVTVSFTEKPSWLEAKLTTNQLQLKFSPSFLEIGTQTLSFSISDGKTSSSYTYRLQVTENPATFEDVPLTKNGLLGSWLLSNKTQFHFFADNKGLYKDKTGKLYTTTWKTENGFAYVSIANSGSYIELEGLYKRNNRYRFFVSGTPDGEYNANSEVISTKYVDGLYAVPGKINSSASELSDTNIEFVNIGKLTTDFAYTKTTTFAYKATTRKPQNASLSNLDILSDKRLTLQLETQVENRQTREVDNIFFDASLVSLKPIFSDGDLFIFEQSFIPVLSEVSKDIVLEHYNGVKEFLAAEQKNQVVYRRLHNSVIAPLESGSSYYGQFILPDNYKNQYQSNESSQLFIDANNTGRLRQSSANEDFPLRDIELSWSVEGNKLTLEIDDQTYVYQHLVDQRGESLLYGFHRENASKRITPFGKVETVNFTEQQLLGVYQDLTNNSLFDSYPSFLHLRDAGKSGFIGNPNPAGLTFRELWLLNQDNSIQLLRYTFGCPDNSTFSSCLQFLKEKGSYISTRKMYPVKVTDNYYYFSYLSYRKDGEKTYQSDIVRKFKKLSAN